MQLPLRAVFLGAPGEPVYKDDKIVKLKQFLPGVKREAAALQEVLGKDNFVALGYGGKQQQRAYKRQMEQCHMAGNVFIASAHGDATQGIALLDSKLHYKDFLQNLSWDFAQQVTVILSCCYLGQREKVQQEMLGMVSALWARGCVSVVSALWAVNDAAAARFTPIFVERLQHHLQQGVTHPRGRALKETMDILREEFPDPYYFGAFFISGSN